MGQAIFLYSEPLCTQGQALKRENIKYTTFAVYLLSHQKSASQELAELEPGDVPDSAQ